MVTVALLLLPGSSAVADRTTVPLGAPAEAVGAPPAPVASAAGSVPLSNGSGSTVTASNGSAGWSMVLNSSESPPGRNFGSFAYDPAEGGSVLFGGQSEIGLEPLLNDTWVFRGDRWIELCSGTSAAPACRTSPSPRYYAGMAYDAAMGALVLFGGIPGGGFGSFNDTWEFANGSWSELSPPTSPPQSTSEYRPFGMVYDAADGYVLLYSVHSGTWAFSNGTWTHLHPSTEPSAIGTMFYDPALRRVLLWSGSEMWEFGGGNWTAESPIAGPVAGETFAGAYDAPFDYGVAFGPGGGYDNSTWVYSDGTWTNESASLGNAPTLNALQDPTYSYDAAAEVLVELDGAVPQPNGNWGYLNQTWILHDPFRLTVTASATVRDVGQTVAYSVAAAGGRAPYDLRLTSVPPGCAVPSNLTPPLLLSCAPASPGTFALGVVATDSLNGSVAASVPLAVGPALGVSASVAPNPTTVGVPVALEGTVSGGTAPVRSTWTIISPGNGSPNATWVGTEANYTFGATGSYVATFAASDAANVTEEWSVRIEVYSTIALAARANRTVVDAGMPIGFAATASGGDAPLAYAWAFGDGGTATTNVTSHVYRVAGAYTATVRATDSAAASALAQVPVRVNPALSATAEANVTRVGLYASVNFSGRIAGGTPPYTYWWDFGNEGSAYTATVEHPFTVTGTMTVSLTVNDSVGASRTSTIEVAVVAATPPSHPGNTTSAAGAPTWAYAVGAAAAVLVVAAAVAAGVRRRQGRRPGPPPTEGRGPPA